MRRADAYSSAYLCVHLRPLRVTFAAPIGALKSGRG